MFLRSNPLFQKLIAFFTSLHFQKSFELSIVYLFRSFLTICYFMLLIFLIFLYKHYLQLTLASFIFRI